MKLLKKIGEYALRALALCFVAAFWLLAAYFVGCLTIVFTIGLFSERLADMTLDSRIATAAAGGFVILCGRLVSRACKRRRAIEDEIRPVLDIQIGEPPPPGRVQRFYEKDGALDRFFERYFWWIEDIGDKSSRLSELFAELPIVVRLLVCFVLVLIVFTIGASVMWVKGEPFQAQWWMIPAAIFVGCMVIYMAFWVIWLALLAILLPLAAPYYAWRAVTSIREWLANNLPRRVVLWDRSWQLRRMGRRQLQGYAAEAAMRSPLEWLLTLVAIALLALAVAGVGWVLKHANNHTGEEDDTEEVYDAGH